MSSTPPRPSDRKLHWAQRLDNLATKTGEKYGLTENPRPPGCRKLSGRPAWRIRIGSYRVIYEIHDDRLLVFVVAIGARREIYR
ncbi:MAG: type II toxin-antitoxin system RelE/ParE family toxin [Acidobacteria bacterium]|nr:MAG: type II toxin-antitoxin system RelE/ParE family toxin [Acidobacteriota bacterium]